MKEKMIEIIRKYREPMSYIVCGALTTFVSLSSFYFCVSTFLNSENAIHLQIANIIAWICAVIFAFFSNRKFVFQSEANLYYEAIRFAGSRLSTLVIDMLMMAVLVSVFRVNDKIAKVIVQVIVFVANYLLSKLVVFRK